MRGAMMNKSVLVIMAGGTGGHVFPGLAVANLMLEKGWKIDWIGTADKMEANLVPKYGFPIHFITIGGVRGKSLVTKLWTPFKLLGALFQSISLLRKLKPNVVLGMGGYASGPGGIAAWLLNIPLVVHEQNAVFGMTNKYLARLATYTLTGFDIVNIQKLSNTKHLPKNTHYVGNPIRKGFFNIAPKNLAEHASTHQHSLPKDIVNILIVGGSLGALALNQIVPKVLLKLAELTRNFTIIVKHQSGKDKLMPVQEAYQNMPNVEVLEFIDNMESAFSWSDIVICRAGALTVSEVAGAGRTAIFVPLPFAVDDHQTVNARYLSDQGAALLISQSTLDETLLSTLDELCSGIEKRQVMAAKAKACAHQHATSEVAAFIEKAVDVKMSSKIQDNNKEERGK
jgi:UDP-N-acetylglucosamine--N-acetylmuramyl-(pentapeptide) pyrophosphoryl-undecaprenol N-acetylglucosamine transferase